MVVEAEEGDDTTTSEDEDDALHDRALYCGGEDFLRVESDYNNYRRTNRLLLVCCASTQCVGF